MARRSLTRRFELDAIRGRLLHRAAPEVFDPAVLAGLPAPAQRYLRHSIAPGAPLAAGVRLTMRGAMRMKPGGRLLPMRARQVLAPSRGLVWEARIGTRLLWFSGFDLYAEGRGELHWWLYGLVPLVHAGGTDIDRAAAGRVGGESIFVPGSLLPRRGVRWTEVDDDSARVRVELDGEAVEITIGVDDAGRPQRVSFPRWREDAGDGKPGLVAFAVDGFENERTFGGYTIPTVFRAGWRLGEADEFPFFFATIESAEFE
jgi:hypothetical protein